ncbi:delta-12 fatty acid desaturase [Pseudohyphozyma bogoriensis]|nr:delta-12 fatty acid desaturase [Pseudohyphozyma bogoriensis]
MATHRTTGTPAATKEVDLTSSQRDVPAFTPPSFTVKDLLGAIPKHCFERSAIRSGSYAVVELAVIAALFYAASFISPAFGKHGAVLAGTPGTLANAALWLTYWVVQSWFMTGIWVVGGHQAFSTSKFINNAVGLVLHSSLFVPYHSWRISHARHHAATGHMTRDEVFVPKSRSYVKLGKEGEEKGTGKKSVARTGKFKGEMLDELLEDAPAYRLFWLIAQQTVGWWMYLATNASGQKGYPKGTNHFNPDSYIFAPHHKWQIILSDAGILAMAAVLKFASTKIGWAGVGVYYFIPYVLVNHWLVMITFLQHTDPIIPHYRASEWTFPRGALCTIDRNLLGPIVGPWIMHGICETHVAHHINSKIPHYHAWEATEALKEFLGPYYMSTDENMFVSLWKSYRYCRFVEDDDDVCFYKDAHGQVSRTVALAEKDSGVEML